MAPDARCSSPHISESAAPELPTNAAYTTNCASWPPVIDCCEHLMRAEP